MKMVDFTRVSETVHVSGLKQFEYNSYKTELWIILAPDNGFPRAPDDSVCDAFHYSTLE